MSDPEAAPAGGGSADATGAATPLPRAAARRSLIEAALWGTAFAVAALWPQLFFAYPAGQDTPNHLARAFILLNPDDPLLSQHFAVEWHLVPNLAWDAFAVVLGRWLPLDVTLKLFIAAGMGLTILGVFLINRRIAGRWTWTPLLAVPFLFNTAHSRGFLGYSIGFGLALLATAWWLCLGERRWKLRLAGAMVLSTLLFYVHLVAWGIYGVVLLGARLTELATAWRQQGRAAFLPWVLTTLRDGTQALPPLLIFIAAAFWGPGHVTLAGTISEFHGLLDRLNEARHIIDTGAWFPSVFLAAILALYALVALWLRHVRLSLVHAIAIALLLALFLFMPNQIYSTHFIVWRLASAAAFLALASAIPLRPVTAPASRMALGLFLGVTLCLSGWQAHATINSDVERHQFLQLIERVPPGSTLLMLHEGVRVSDLEFDRLGIFHVGAYAVLERRVMVQSLFANPAQQPIRYRAPEFGDVTVNGRVFVEDLSPSLEERSRSLSSHAEDFQWVAVHGPAPEADGDWLSPQRFRPAGAVGGFRLYCRAAPSPGAACPDGNAP